MAHAQLLTNHVEDFAYLKIRRKKNVKTNGQLLETWKHENKIKNYENGIK